MNQKKIIYDVLRAIEKGDDLAKLKFSDFGLSLIEFRDLIDQIQDDDLIKGASVPRGQGNPDKMVLLGAAKITVKGLIYLENNSSLAETICD